MGMNSGYGGGYGGGYGQPRGGFGNIGMSGPGQMQTQGMPQMGTQPAQSPAYQSAFGYNQPAGPVVADPAPGYPGAPPPTFQPPEPMTRPPQPLPTWQPPNEPLTRPPMQPPTFQPPVSPPTDPMARQPQPAPTYNPYASFFRNGRGTY